MQDTSPSIGSRQARGRLAQFGVGVAALGWVGGAVAASVAAEHRLAVGPDGTGQAITLATSFLLWPLLLLGGWAWSRWQRRLALRSLVCSASPPTTSARSRQRRSRSLPR